MMSISPRHFHLYCGTMPAKLRRSSNVKSVPDTASVRCAELMRRTRRSVGTYTQVSSFLVCAVSSVRLLVAVRHDEDAARVERRVDLDAERVLALLAAEHVAACLSRYSGSTRCESWIVFAVPS